MSFVQLHLYIIIIIYCTTHFNDVPNARNALSADISLILLFLLDQWTSWASVCRAPDLLLAIFAQNLLDR